jgi:tetratricopeptide (TPR) repeat protein
VKDVAFSPNDRHLVSVGGNGMVLVWDVETGNEVIALEGHRDIVGHALFSPDGRRLATAGHDQQIRIWDMTADLASGQVPVPVHILSGHTDRVNGLSFSRDGRRLASAGLDGTIRIWDVESGSEALALRGLGGQVNSVAFSPDGRVLVTGAGDIKVWEADAPQGPEARIEGRENARGSFRPAPLAPHPSVIAWHQAEAQACAAARPTHWFGVAFHVSRLIEAQPGAWQLHHRRAVAEMELARWPAADRDFTRSIELGATDWNVWFAQALSRLRLGDSDAYRRSCAAMLERFGKTAHLGIADHTAWICALAPAAVADLDQPLRLAEKIVAAEPQNAAYCNTLGALLYRAGRFLPAVERLNNAIRLRDGKGTPEDWLFLAMAHHRLGHKEEARAWLNKAAQWIDATKNEKPSADRPIPAADRLAQLDLLRREADGLLAAAGVGMANGSGCLNANGVRYDLPLTGTDSARGAEFLRAVRPNGLSWSGGGHTLEVADGKITLDGKSYGTVRSGDVVKLMPDGELSVNGQKRQPV